MLRGRRSLQARVKLFRVLALLAEWSMTLSTTSQGSEGDWNMASDFEGTATSLSKVRTLPSFPGPI